MRAGNRKTFNGNSIKCEIVEGNKCFHSTGGLTVLSLRRRVGLYIVYCSSSYITKNTA